VKVKIESKKRENGPFIRFFFFPHNKRIWLDFRYSHSKKMLFLQIYVTRIKTLLNQDAFTKVVTYLQY